jgi:polar amino acid transport system permease protein/cystine transport system permease protein
VHLDFGVAWKFLPILLHASLLTIALFVLSQVLGTLAAFFVALARMSPRAWLRRPAAAYIWVVRGTPLLLHLFFVYYAAPAIGITLDAFPAAIIAMSASAAAYNAEIIRAGLQAVHRGQLEAAHAVGMTYGQVVRRIVLPQAVRIVVPPYMGNAISHCKNSSLASVITVPELMLTAQMIYSSTYRAIEILTVTGLIYLVLTSCLSALQMYLEHVTTYERRGLGGARRRRLRLDTPVPMTPAS